MRKSMKIYVDCANCAAKVEEAIKKIEGVHSARVNFMTQKLILDADDDDWNEVIKEVKRAGKKIDSDTEIYV